MSSDPNRLVGRESRKAYAARCASGFWTRFLAGPVVLDIGYKGGEPDAVPILEHAVGIELGYPGYDDLRLPWPDGSVDAVHASHVLEHVSPPEGYLREWFRVLRIGGHLVLTVPHAFLYERRLTVPPSRWSSEHLRSYTPASLLAETERALPANSYRVRLLRDEDLGYRYDLPPDAHPVGCLEIVLVLQKILPPEWSVEP